MNKTDKKPPLTFTTKCLYSKKKFKVLGYDVFNNALEEHRKHIKT